MNNTPEYLMGSFFQKQKAVIPHVRRCYGISGFGLYVLIIAVLLDSDDLEVSMGEIASKLIDLPVHWAQLAKLVNDPALFYQRNGIIYSKQLKEFCDGQELK